jgi:hypothetical protein
MRCFYACISFIVLLACSCQPSLDFEIPQGPARLTANAMFYPDSVWQVELTLNRAILDTGRFAPVRDASVTILPQGMPAIELQYMGENRFSGNSIYRAQSARPRVGQAYSLQISNPGMDVLRAQSSVPDITPILSFEWDTLDIRSVVVDNIPRVAYGMKVRFADPPAQNFYSISVQIKLQLVLYSSSFSSRKGRDTFIIEELSSLLTIQSDNPIVDNPLNRYRSELLFKDISFNGRDYELKFYMLSERPQNDRVPFLDQFTKPGFLGSGTFPDTIFTRQGEVAYLPYSTFKSHSLSVILRSTTQEYYRYLYTRDLQGAVNNNPFAQPVQVFSNTSNGIGIFAGFNQSEQPVTFR